MPPSLLQSQSARRIELNPITGRVPWGLGQVWWCFGVHPGHLRRTLTSAAVALAACNIYTTRLGPALGACACPPTHAYTYVPRALVGIRPRPLTKPEPHTRCLPVLRPLHLARACSVVWRQLQAWGHACGAVQLASWPSASAGPGRTCGRDGTSNTCPTAEGSTKRRHGAGRSKKAARQLQPGAMRSSRLPAAQQKDSNIQGETERHSFVSSIFRILRHGAC